MTSGMPYGISSRTLRRVHIHEGGRLAIPHLAHRTAGSCAGIEVSPRRIRGGAGKLHDRDCDLRPAGPHAALVVWRSLHLSTDPASHGPVTTVRSRVPR